MERLQAIGTLLPRCQLLGINHKDFLHELLGVRLARSINQLLIILLEILRLSATLADLRRLVGDLVDEGVMKDADGALATSQAVGEPNNVLEAICEHIQEFVAMVVVGANILDRDDESTHKVASKLVEGVELLSALLVVNDLLVV